MPPKKKRIKKSKMAQAPKVQPKPGRPAYPVKKKDMSWAEPKKDTSGALGMWREASTKAREKTGHKGMICKGSDCYKEAKQIMETQKKAQKIAPIIAKAKGK